MNSVAFSALRLAFAFLISLLMVMDVDAKKKRGRQDVDESPRQRVYTILRNTLILVLSPVIFVFVKSILTDPAVPHILRALLSEMKKRFMYLGGPRKEVDVESAARYRHSSASD